MPEGTEPAAVAKVAPDPRTSLPTATINSGADRWFARARRQWPVTAAAISAAAVFVATGILRGTYPFGERSRNTYDLGHQFIPMAAHLRDLVTGQGAGDLLFNWQSGFGVPFIGDFMAYVGSSLSWIALVLPRDRIDLALFLIATVAIGLAAGAMTAYLRLLRPNGPVWVAITAGASYGACAWAVGEAAYMTLWLSGLIAFPVICLLCEWILQRRSIVSAVVAPLVVTLLWTSHFYTVYMATIGAAVVTLARCLAGEPHESWRWPLTGAVRCAVAVVLGIALSAPLLMPTFAQVQAATPSPERNFHPIEPQFFLARLLPGSDGMGFAPGLTVGTVMLVLALTFPLNRRVAVRQRLVWSVAVALTTASLQIPLTHRAWHGFDTPDGNPFRQAFVVAGMLVIIGWLSASAGVRSIVASVVPVAVVLGLFAWTWDFPHITPGTHIAVPVVIGLAGIAWLVMRRRGPAWLRGCTVAVLMVAVLAEGTLTAAVIDADRSKLLSATPYWGKQHTKARSLVESADDWPRHRTAPGDLTTSNDPMLIGGQGPQHYSSTIPLRTTEALLALGFGYSAYGRDLEDPQNPVVDAIFSIHGRVVRDRGLQLARNADVAPLVTVRPAQLWQSPDPAPFGVQETALGSDVYTVPELHVGPTRSGTATVVAQCRPGSEVWIAAPEYVGSVFFDGAWRPLAMGRRPGIYSGAVLRRAGTAAANGRVEVTLRVVRGRLPKTALGCLDRRLLQTAVAKLTAADAIDVHGHSLTARLSSGPAATAVVGVVGIEGWACSVDGSPAPLGSDAAGLLAVPVPAGASELACTFTPPGLRAGLAVGAGAALCLLLFAGALAVRRRRRSRKQRRQLSEGADAVAGPSRVTVGVLESADGVHAERRGGGEFVVAAVSDVDTFRRTDAECSARRHVDGRLRLGDTQL